MPQRSLARLRKLLISGPMLAALLLTTPSVAQTMEQIREACRADATPEVQSCMQAKKGSGDRESNRAACRNAVRPMVRACMDRATKKAAAGKAAPAAPRTDLGAASADANAVANTLVAPPRTISDITAILDNERPDETKIAKLKADADRATPGKGSPKELISFHFDRATARAFLARNQEALDDALKAMEIAEKIGDFSEMKRIRRFVGNQYSALGDPKKSVEIYKLMVTEGDRPGSRGSIIGASRNLAQVLISMGDVSQADAHVRRVAAMVQEARGSPYPNWRKAYALHGSSWEADADIMRGIVFESRGQYREAEVAFLRAEAFRRASLQKLSQMDKPPPREQIMLAADSHLLAAARVKSRQGNHSEAEADARRAMLSTLKNVGKYHPQTPHFIIVLADILVEQGRYQEAEKLLLAALDVQRKIGLGEGTPAMAKVLSHLGSVLVTQRKGKEAEVIYSELERSVSDWPAARRNVFLLTNSRISALYASGQIEAGIAAAEQRVKNQHARFGADHTETANARGTLAIGYALAHRDAEAIREFKVAIPLMTTASRLSNDDDETSLVGAKSQRLQTIVETYLRLLDRVSPGSSDVSVESFALADSIRGQSVQQALAASSARMAAKDAAMAELVRDEQDLDKRTKAQLGLLNNALSLPSGERDDAMVQTIRATIEKLRGDRQKAQREITRRFPAYAELIDPAPPTVPQIQATLQPDEAFVSFYFGRTASFVWAVPKSGPIAFAVIPLTSVQLEAKVRKLREALEPQAEMLSDIPAFDLETGYELYRALLEPVENGWKPAKNLVVVTNGALGLLPLSLLPTAPFQIKDSDTPFAGYRDVPWLARTHAVSLVPSASALRTLRALPAGKAKRQDLIGFGDPFFNAEQARDAEAEMPETIADASTVMRGSLRGLRLLRRSSPQLEGVDSAGLSILPRLPDTADELKSMAAALESDPSKILYLGKDANEQRVKSVDLSGFKTVAFATHGLVPGDLDGLSQPALALSAPDVSDSDGDGLLTMEEILALKLDADWVVLSACNTGTGAGAGAEAASGLGRAFFYAGTRALLVTNWSVHSASARDLVTDLFRRQSLDASITRSEALRQAMLALIDGKGFTDEDDKTLFSYAHPLFWAPYSIIGDGGRT